MTGSATNATLNWPEVMDAAEDDDSSGFCLACGHHQHGVEPDARKYPCESCGEHRVYGAEEIVLMFG